MVGREYIIRAAMAVDTSMSRAFRRALGLPAPERTPKAATVVSAWRAELMEADVMECFLNHTSPMDLLHGQS